MRDRHLHRLTIALLGAFLPLLLMSHAAHAQDVKAQAKQHFSAGEAHFKAGDYRTAITEFGAADQLVPSPILSYNIGLCHERLGEDDLAVQRYRDYLVRRPDAANRAQVEDRIAQAEQRLAAKKPAAPAPVPVAPPTAAEGPAAPRPATPALPATEGPAAPGPPTEGPAAPTVATPAPAGNVDPDLARRLPRRPGAAAPAPGGGNGLGALAQASSPPTRGDAEMAPPLTAEPSTPADSDKHSKATPLYKEWWFWAVVGVSAIIVIDMASGSSNSNSVAKPGAPSGAVLLRF